MINLGIQFIFNEIINTVDKLKKENYNKVRVYLLYYNNNNSFIEIERLDDPKDNQTTTTTTFIKIEDDNIIMNSILDELYFCLPKLEIDFIIWLLEEIVKYNMTIKKWW